MKLPNLKSGLKHEYEFLKRFFETKNFKTTRIKVNRLLKYKQIFADRLREMRPQHLPEESFKTYKFCVPPAFAVSQKYTTCRKWQSCPWCFIRLLTALEKDCKLELETNPFLKLYRSETEVPICRGFVTAEDELRINDVVLPCIPANQLRKLGFEYLWQIRFFSFTRVPMIRNDKPSKIGLVQTADWNNVFAKVVRYGLSEYDVDVTEHMEGDFGGKIKWEEVSEVRPEKVGWINWFRQEHLYPVQVTGGSSGLPKIHNLRISRCRNV
jgi:hypothetical protein